jgi:glycerol-3-phosphate acyltransferase PlsX
MLEAKMAVAIDAMGGDNAPASTVAGALIAQRAGIDVTLVGDSAILERELIRQGSESALDIIHAPEAVPMDEHAALSVRGNRQTSLWVGINTLKNGEIDAFLSVGNTGAAMATALVGLGRLPGIERPALGGILPTSDGKQVMFLDIGANADARPPQLVQFAHLGSAYMRSVFKIQTPRVALLSIGSEETKGSNLVIETHKLLTVEKHLNFVGNVEAHDILSRGSAVGGADVIVTDGFTGNMCIKLGEGILGTLISTLRTAAEDSMRAKIGGLLLSPALQYTRDSLDFRKHGAVMLLGVQGPIFIGHGRSDSTAIASALTTADYAVKNNIALALDEEARIITPSEID